MPSMNPKKMAYTVYLLPVAEKELKKLPEKIQKQIFEIIHSLKFPFQIPAIRMQKIPIELKWVIIVFHTKSMPRK